MRCSRNPSLLLLLLLWGCAAPPADSGALSVRAAWLERMNPRPMLHVELEQGFAQELLDALHNGVTLRYQWFYEISDGSGEVLEGTGNIDIAYRSLTRSYTLGGPNPGERVALPDVAAVEAALEELRIELGEAPQPVPGGRGSARFRIELDVAVLPPPLRLPAHLSPAWRQDSGWHRWPLPAVSAGDDGTGLE